MAIVDQIPCADVAAVMKRSADDRGQRREPGGDEPRNSQKPLSPFWVDGVLIASLALEPAWWMVQPIIATATIGRVTALSRKIGRSRRGWMRMSGNWKSHCGCVAYGQHSYCLVLGIRVRSAAATASKERSLEKAKIDDELGLRRGRSRACRRTSSQLTPAECS